MKALGRAVSYRRCGAPWATGCPRPCVEPSPSGRQRASPRRAGRRGTPPAPPSPAGPPLPLLLWFRRRCCRPTIRNGGVVETKGSGLEQESLPSIVVSPAVVLRARVPGLIRSGKGGPPEVPTADLKNQRSAGRPGAAGGRLQRKAQGRMGEGAAVAARTSLRPSPSSRGSSPGGTAARCRRNRLR